MRPGSYYSSAGPAQRGFTFMAVLLLLTLCMLGLAVAGPIWSQQAQREREQMLLRVGALYAQALLSYRDASPGSAAQFPMRLEALLVDPRYPSLRRHIRELYADPMNPGQPWGLVRDAEGRIVGVHSQSDARPIGQGVHDLGVLVVPAATHYADWKFSPKVGTP